MGKPSKTVSWDRYRQRITRAMVFIEQNLDERPTIEEIAAAAPFSRFHFSRVFAVITGETVSDYIRRLQLQHAAQLLHLAPKRNITDIAFSCGFSSSQNFAKAFKQAFGQSPTAFRARKQKDIAFRTSGNAKQANDRLNRRLNSLLTEDKFMSANELSVELKEIPEMHVAFLRRFGAYGPEIGPLFEEVVGWAFQKGLGANMQVIALYHDNPESVTIDKLRSDACVTVPAGTQPEAPIATQTIQGGLYATYRIQIKTADFHEAWDQLVGRWMPQSGYEPAQGPGMEIYYGQPPEDEKGLWDVELCVPVLPLKD